jgi:hypothetical protein
MFRRARFALTESTLGRETFDAAAEKEKEREYQRADLRLAQELATT